MKDSTENMEQCLICKDFWINILKQPKITMTNGCIVGCHLMIVGKKSLKNGKVSEKMSRRMGKCDKCNKLIKRIKKYLIQNGIQDTDSIKNEKVKVRN